MVNHDFKILIPQFNESSWLLVLVNLVLIYFIFNINLSYSENSFKTFSLNFFKYSLKI